MIVFLAHRRVSLIGNADVVYGSLMTKPSRDSRFAGWPLVGYCGLLLLVVSLLRFATLGTGEEGLRAMVRFTAQLSLILFSAAFTASSLHALWPRSDWAQWLRANRRYLGVSFALSHTLHLVLLIFLGRVSQEFADNIQAATIYGGGLAYVFVYAMTATSFDRSAAWLGPRRWHLLHKVGAYYIWFIFFQSYVPRAFVSPFYIPFAVVLIADVGLRIWAGARKRNLARTDEVATQRLKAG
jgi:hypothetical protein